MEETKTAWTNPCCRGDSMLGNTYYLHSQNNWNTAAIFPSWLKISVEEQITHTLQLLFDKRMIHLPMATVKLEIKENRLLIRLTAYCTDLMQSLYISCFNQLKCEYKKELTKHDHSSLSTQTLKLVQFCYIVPKIYYSCLT